ncbi:Thioredoxin domain-containing protein [Anopheles sinensis]|uniref:Thioredoxin domain-containing protein n=1 Tax=Anopheles sinensis TaxID=74873 RepID=A0A084WLZ8_ANOSI|nr:Thioredoxin domain-containing protein [Anopheles sinensis]
MVTARSRAACTDRHRKRTAPGGPLGGKLAHDKDKEFTLRSPVATISTLRFRAYINRIPEAAALCHVRPEGAGRPEMGRKRLRERESHRDEARAMSSGADMNGAVKVRPDRISSHAEMRKISSFCCSSKVGNVCDLR